MTGFASLPAVRARARWRGAGPWLRIGILFCLGCLSALAHAPYFFQPAYIVGLVFLLWALDDARRARRPLRAAFVRAWCFGAGYFLASTYWVANAFIVNADYVWLIWAPLTLFPGGLALFWALPALVYVRFAPKGPPRITVFAIIFLAAEMARSVILSGFPWNLSAHVFEAGGAISQIASVIGASGLSGFVLFAFAAPAALVGPGKTLQRALPLLAGFVALAGFWAFGAARLDRAELETTDHVVRIAQLDWPQTELRPENIDAVLDGYIALSTQHSLDGVDALVWPEGAIPAWLMNEPEILQKLHANLPEGTVLIAGAPHVEFGIGSRRDLYFNALHALRIEPDGVSVLGRYDKARLVPFGEANTLAALTRPFGLDTLSQYGFGFDAGSGPAVLALEGLPPFAPLICYEVIYPRWIKRGDERPQWMLNISNDAWFGGLGGPGQLLNQAAYRSIEEGLPTVRSASAGPSGQIDPFGRSIVPTIVDYTGMQDLTLVKALDETVYAEYPVSVWLIAFLFFAVFSAYFSSDLLRRARLQVHNRV